MVVWYTTPKEKPTGSNSSATSWSCWVSSEMHTAPIRPLPQEASFPVESVQWHCLPSPFTSRYGSFPPPRSTSFCLILSLHWLTPSHGALSEGAQLICAPLPWDMAFPDAERCTAELQSFWLPHSLQRSHLTDDRAGPSLRARHGPSTTLPNHGADFEFSDS